MVGVFPSMTSCFIAIGSTSQQERMAEQTTHLMAGTGEDKKGKKRGWVPSSPHLKTSRPHLSTPPCSGEGLDSRPSVRGPLEDKIRATAGGL